jgi:hypothetical protein
LNPGHVGVIYSDDKIIVYLYPDVPLEWKNTHAYMLQYLEGRILLSLPLNSTGYIA